MARAHGSRGILLFAGDLSGRTEQSHRHGGEVTDAERNQAEGCCRPPTPRESGLPERCAVRPAWIPCRPARSIKSGCGGWRHGPSFTRSSFRATRAWSATRGDADFDDAQLPDDARRTGAVPLRSSIRRLLQQIGREVCPQRKRAGCEPGDPCLLSLTAAEANDQLPKELA